MYIYTCTLKLLEHTFFSSREINALFQTEALIGNYALCYALGFCQAPYHIDGTIYYKEHLSQLNTQGIYVTPAKIKDDPKFTITQFNAQTDTYWYKFDQNAITVDKNKKARAVNFPQTGKIKMLALGNNAIFYILSDNAIDADIPPYIRLGKFMSKAKVTTRRHNLEPGEQQTTYLDMVLNPVDLPESLQLKRFDICNIHPSTFLKNVEATGRFYELSGKVYLPVGMKFGVDQL
jgi:CRISPR-associated protein Csc1